VFVRDLDENDAHAVRIRDPHLQQSPRLPLRGPHDVNTFRLKALVLGPEVPDLHPEGEIARRRRVAGSGNLEKAAAEEEDEPRIVGWAELAVDSETERVPIETSTAIPVSRSQQDTATEDFHTPIMPRARRHRLATAGSWQHDGWVKLKLDLHDIYNRGDEIERALRGIIDEAVAKKAPLVEIIPGKGSGQLKKRVLRFLDRKEIKALYHRVEKDSDNFGRVFVHFRWKRL
jgi:DNA-nicking Smr family endonuclease